MISFSHKYPSEVVIPIISILYMKKLRMEKFSNLYSWYAPMPTWQSVRKEALKRY